MKRKSFLQKTLIIVIIAASLLTFLDCAKSDDTPPAIMDTEMITCTVDILTNQGHVLVVTEEDVVAGVEKTYDIQGSANHTHSVTITANNFIQLQNNQQISLNTTSGDGHIHNITIVCG